MKAIVLGGANTVWDDAEAALNMFTPDLTIAVNDIGTRWAGHIDHWVTLHPEKMAGWIRARNARGFPGGFVTWSHKGGHLDRRSADWAGSSGLFAVKIALELGCTHVVACGVPMEPDKGHFFDKSTWNDAHQFRRGWERRREEIAPFVRSMSGWTKGLLGEPSPQWLSD
jgi:hypothetical protein